ncbi:MAG TPA: insulinase family protein, partial [Spirochaetota bacterium]|nr:insulinase family protein [Spirochaetota bacterium]
MNTLKKTIVGVLTLLAAARADAAIRDAGAYLRAQVVQRTLSNGIEVLMLDRGAAPTLALVISFRVGSADESYDTIGMAHMLEHMLFKGTVT